MEQITPKMQLAMQLSLMNTKLSKRLDCKLSLHGISFTEFQVMYNLSLEKDMTLRRIDLAESIGITASGVTRLLLPMQKIKLVKKERNKRDARVSLVKLTNTGLQILQDALLSFNEISVSAFDGLNRKEIEQLLKLIAKL